MDSLQKGINHQLELAQKIIEHTGCSLFLTGKAGTGKTTFLHNLRSTSRKRMVICAPTGIAAINAGGVTLHSFFQLDFGVYVPGMKRQTNRRMSFNKEKIRMIRGLDLLVIDEVSMVRADLLDAVDAVLRRYRDRTQPFGGVQLLLIGDLQQLPPVVVENERAMLEAHYRSPYFFDSHALESLDYVTVELTQVYRQSDSDFIELLNAVRDNRAAADVLKRLNERYIPGFNPPDSEGYVRLTTHNHLAAMANSSRLNALPGHQHQFKAKISGNFPASSYPADEVLYLKEGAQVMFIKNDTGNERLYYNGLMGKVSAIDSKGVTVTPQDGSEPIYVEPVQWENSRYIVNEERHEIEQQVDGVFRQLPLKLAWSITIHKSQGLTFDRAVIDASSSFSHGQTYVALSRCRTLEGMVLGKPLSAASIICDATVNGYMQQQTSRTPDETMVDSMAAAYRLHLAAGLFNFRTILNALEGVQRLYSENFIRLYPTQVQEFSISIGRMRDELTSVGDKFAMQLNHLYQSDQSDMMCKRIKDASVYFLSKLDTLVSLAAEMPVQHDNSTVQQKLKERLELFESASTIRRTLLETFCKEDFSVERYLDIKAKGAFVRPSAKKKSSTRETASEYSADNINPGLLDMLTKWRREKCAELGVPAYVICNTKTLLAVSNHLPTDLDELGRLPGMGFTTINNIGDEILDIVSEYVASTPGAQRKPLPMPKARKRKGDSARESYEMWQAGKSLQEIAVSRNLSEATVETHVASFINPSDEENLIQLLGRERLEFVKNYYSNNDVSGKSLREIHDDIAQKHDGYEPGYLAIKLLLPSSE